MAAAARIDLPYPEVAVVERPALGAQSDAVADALGRRPVVLGGCCCTHVGAAMGLARRFDRLAVVWFDAHGDLNTPETSPSGNLWGMPFRMLLDAGVIQPQDAALVGARNLDPPEVEYMVSVGLDDSVARALAGADAAYVALDFDVLDPADADPFMPEPDGVRADELESVLHDLASETTVAGVGLTGLVATDRNVTLASRLLAAAGF
jgi:arginase family enzyme